MKKYYSRHRYRSHSGVYFSRPKRPKKRHDVLLPPAWSYRFCARRGHDDDRVCSDFRSPRADICFRLVSAYFSRIYSRHTRALIACIFHAPLFKFWWILARDTFYPRVNLSDPSFQNGLKRSFETGHTVTCPFVYVRFIRRLKRQLYNKVIEFVRKFRLGDRSCETDNRPRNDKFHAPRFVF